MNLVIVESPTKAGTIQKYLGKDYKVVASVGHIRDLAIGGESNLGVDIPNHFTPIYEIYPNKKRTVEKLKKAVAEADEVFLATDPDREGEAISWHLAQVLDLPVETTKRLEFHEITYHAIQDAVKNPRYIDMDLVQSQETRRILDRIIGFKLSGLLKSKIDSLSAGRVQSVALKLIVEREKEINAFVPQEYWLFYADTQAGKKDAKTQLITIDGQEAKINNEEEAKKIEERLPSTLKVLSVSSEEKSHASRPPFTTSSLQIEASRLFGFTSSKTMKLAQKLYEGVKVDDKKTTGLITYMRTDSTRLSPVFINNCKQYIGETFGEQYVGVAKGFKAGDHVQNAHEAIRPTDVHLDPDSLKERLEEDEYKLYCLIYARTLASMMVARKTLDGRFVFAGNGLEFELKSSKQLFDGYSHIYKPFEKLEKDSEYSFTENQEVAVVNHELEQKFTKPPYRYSEAMLIKELDDLGIGRPSTYASILDTIKDPKRDYVHIQQKSLVPTSQGTLTVEQLDLFFRSIINVDYTANMENQLDKIAEGEFSKVAILEEFYEGFSKLYSIAQEKMETLQPETVGENCPNCGRELVYKKGRFGKFIGCSGYPECKYIRKIEKPIPENAKVCPKCQTGRMVIRKGKKGAFLGCTNYPACDHMEFFKKKF